MDAGSRGRGSEDTMTGKGASWHPIIHAWPSSSVTFSAIGSSGDGLKSGEINVNEVLNNLPLPSHSSVMIISGCLSTQIGVKETPDGNTHLSHPMMCIPDRLLAATFATDLMKRQTLIINILQISHHSELVRQLGKFTANLS